MFDTKYVIVVREDLAAWQKLNVTAFLAGGVIAATPEILGEVYKDAAGQHYHAMSVQPTIILAADAGTMAKIHQRSLDRNVRSALYIEEMFTTGHDAANREVFGKFSPETAKVVGIGFRTEKKIADKITRGARMHA